MANSQTTERELQNAVRAEARAHDLHEKAGRTLAETDATDRVEVVEAVGTTRTLAALAMVALRSGHAADGAAALDFANQAWSEAKRQVLLPDAQRGAREIETSHKGIETRFGPEAKRIARRISRATAWQAEVQRGTGKDAAYSVVAEKHGLKCGQTIRRAVKKAKKLKEID